MNKANMENLQRVHLDALLFAGGMEMVFEFVLGGDKQRPHVEWLLKQMPDGQQNSHTSASRKEELLQALVRLVPDSPIRVSAHLQPCRYTTTTALPKDATALLMRSLHHARVVCPLRLDSSQLEAALMMLRPASLGSWGLRDTAISVFDVEVQADTAEGKEQPSVRCQSLNIMLFCIV